MDRTEAQAVNNPCGECSGWPSPRAWGPGRSPPFRASCRKPSTGAAALAADVPPSGIISPSGLRDGAATLAEAAERAAEYAGWLRALAYAGYELEGTIVEDCGVYSARGVGCWPA